MQPTANVLTQTTITAVFMSNKLEVARIVQTVRHIRQIASELTIVMTDSAFNRDLAELSMEKLFFVPYIKESVGRLGVVLSKALELSPNSNKFIVFKEASLGSIPDQKHFRLGRNNYDLIMLKDPEVIILSNRYARHLASSGETPSTKNASLNGFSSKMSLKQIIESPKDAARQQLTIIKFATVGGSGVIVNLVVLTLLKVWLGVILANALAVELSIINNFVWNDKYTFAINSVKDGEKTNLLSKLTRLVKYNVVSLVSLGVNEAVFYFSYSNGIWYIWSSILAVGAAFIVNYSGSSKWAWRVALRSSNSAKD